MKIILLGALLLNISCATQTKWAAKDPAKKNVSFKSGTIEITPISSHNGYSQSKDMLTVNAKITNSSNKLIKFDPTHITVRAESGETISVMNNQEIKSHTDRVGAFATAIASGAYANPSGTQSNLYVEFTSKMLKSGSIAPNGFTAGVLYFAIPKAGADSVDFRFYESLKSEGSLVFTKQKAQTRSARHREIASQP
jgi:hypothetical protein